MEKEYLLNARECLAFIEKSVSAFHAVENAKEMLRAGGFNALREGEEWELRPGEGYYVERNDSSLIAFRVPEGEIRGFHIIASHSDSPCFKIKPKSQITVEDSYGKLDVEPYGGMIYATWLDRCLSVAGRIVYSDGGELKSRNVNVDEDLLVIPNVAIHMDREINKNLTYNPQVDLLPLLWAGKTQTDQEDVLLKKTALAAGVDQERILGKDLFLYVRDSGKLAGASGELMISPRLDDLECVFASLKGFLGVRPEKYISVCAVFDNEEVGSLTRQGAASSFLEDTLAKAAASLAGEKEMGRLLAESFMISADNAHGVHPNHPEKADPLNRPYLNQGIVIKYHGGQKYTTDAWSEAVMKEICRKTDVPWQTYSNRSDIAGGSTLGNISVGRVPVPSVDIGLPQLAMHSAVETAGTRDLTFLIEAAKVFYAE